MAINFVMVPLPRLGMLTFEQFIGSTLASNLREANKHALAKASFLAGKIRKVEKDKSTSLLKPLPAPFVVNLPAIPETRSGALLEAYRPYDEAMRRLPYDPVKVQGHGMAFCAIFKANKEFVCKTLGLSLDEFDYSLNRTLIKMLRTKRILLGY